MPTFLTDLECNTPVRGGPTGLRSWQVVDSDPSNALARPAGTIAFLRDGTAAWLNTDGTASGWKPVSDLDAPYEANHLVTGGPTSLVSWCVVDSDPSNVLARPAGTIAFLDDGSAAWISTDGTAAGWYPLSAILGNAYLSRLDRLNSDAVAYLGGDGADHVTFWDDFDNLRVHSGTGWPVSSTYVKPTWGRDCVNGGSGGNLSGRLDLCGLSGFAVVKEWLGHFFGVAGITVRPWYFAARVKIYELVANSDYAYIILNTGGGNIGIGLLHSGDHSKLYLGWGAQSGSEWDAGHRVEAATPSSSVWVDLRMRTRGDGVVEYSIDDGPWWSVVLNVGNTGYLELDVIDSGGNNVVVADYVYLRHERP